MEVDTRMDETREVTPINTPVTLNLGGRGRKQRVAVYCRVSVDNEITEMSLESQMVGFTNLINADPNMVLAGVYADEGISGTSVRKRGQFLQMMKDARELKFDTIMTKSVSRFARNTVSCLEAVRELKKLGINVIFLKETLDTGTIMSEMLLTVLSAFSEEESRSISENLKWGLRKRYEMGEGRWSQLYGYRSVKGEIVIEEAEAKVVRRVYELYRTGTSVNDIVDTLNKAGLTSSRGKPWSATTITGMLKNERYAGDLILQKYVTIDFHDHVSVPNVEEKVPANFERPQTYRVKNNHIPIVDRRAHEQVQRILELRSPRGESSLYPYEDTNIICPFCGKKMVTRLMHVQKEKKAVCCFDDGGCKRFSVKTWMLDEVILAGFNELDEIDGTGEAAKRMRAMKDATSPTSISYGFLADTVKKITFQSSAVTRLQNHHKGPATEVHTYDWDVVIEWTNGQSTTIPLPNKNNYSEEPTHVAELYDRYLERMKSGEYVPTTPKNLREKRMRAEQRVVEKVGTTSTKGTKK